MKVVDEFKEFAVKGNALDMAVGIILGTAFNKVVNSVVGDLLMPPIGLLIGGVNFSDLQILLKAGSPAIPATATMAAVPAVADVAIRYGSFVDSVFQFIIIAFSAFMVVKVMNRVIRKREAAPDAPKTS